jgi:hypothetical protein
MDYCNLLSSETLKTDSAVKQSLILKKATTPNLIHPKKAGISTPVNILLKRAF